MITSFLCWGMLRRWELSNLGGDWWDPGVDFSLKNLNLFEKLNFSLFGSSKPHFHLSFRYHFWPSSTHSREDVNFFHEWNIFGVLSGWAEYQSFMWCFYTVCEMFIALKYNPKWQHMPRQWESEIVKQEKKKFCFSCCGFPVWHIRDDSRGIGDWRLGRRKIFSYSAILEF